VSVPAAVVGFAVVAGLLTIIPGLDTALVLRAAITQGRRPAFATALGINTGALAWGAGAAVGVSALLTASAVGYTCVRIAGAGYMIWLGGKMLRSALSKDASSDESMAPAERAPASAWRSWQRGLLTNLLNPKIGAFYIAVLPQFIPAHSPHLAMGLLLAGVHDIEGMVWFAALILGAQSIRRWLGRRSARRTIDGTTGAVLVGFGVKLSLGAR
jgi:threonine/homoserine/homoserine lactone efflux protein